MRAHVQRSRPNANGERIKTAFMEESEQPIEGFAHKIARLFDLVYSKSNSCARLISR